MQVPVRARLISAAQEPFSFQKGLALFAGIVAVGFGALRVASKYQDAQPGDLWIFLSAVIVPTAIIVVALFALSQSGVALSRKLAAAHPDSEVFIAHNASRCRGELRAASVAWSAIPMSRRLNFGLEEIVVDRKGVLVAANLGQPYIGVVLDTDSISIWAGSREPDLVLRVSRSEISSIDVGSISTYGVNEGSLALETPFGSLILVPTRVTGTGFMPLRSVALAETVSNLHEWAGIPPR